MPLGNLSGYQGATGVLIEAQDGANRYVLVYNNLGSALVNGDCVVLTYKQSAGGFYPTVTVPATASVAVKIGVVENSIMGKSQIDDATWGWIQMKGYCPAITKTTASNPVAVDDYLNATNAVRTVASVTSTYDAKTFAVAKSVVGTGVAGTCTGILLDREATI